MEPSINPKKSQAMKKNKMAKFVYNLALYSLTSIITCFFFSSPFWFPSITSHLLISSLSNTISFCFNAKCFFVVGNLIVIILVGESKLKQSPSSDIYDEYVARSQSSFHKEMIKRSPKTLYLQEKMNYDEDNKKDIKINSMPRGEEKKKGMRSCKSEVWGESGLLEKSKSKKEEQSFEGEKIKIGMRSSKSAVWGESMVKGKGKKEEHTSKTSMNDQQKKMGMRSSKSAVWSESVRLKMERGQSTKNVIHHEEKIRMGVRNSKSAIWGESEIAEREIDEGVKKEENEEKMKIGMRSSKSAIWGESEHEERGKGEGVKQEEHEEQMKMGMRSCRSEIWSESEIKRLGKNHVVKEEEQQLNVLNKRVEDFIARVNKQRLLEAKIVDHSKG